MPVSITINGENAAQTLDELFGLSAGLGGRREPVCVPVQPMPTATEAAAQAEQPAAEPAAEPEKRRGRKSKVQEEAEKVADEIDAAEEAKKTEQPANDPAPAAAEPAPVAEQPAALAPVSETDLRAAVVAFLQKTGQDTELGLAIFRKHGGGKLSEVPKDNYGALHADLKAALDALDAGKTVNDLRVERGLAAK